MTHDRGGTGRLYGDGVPADASWAWDAYEADSVGLVELTIDFGGVKAELTMDIKHAEQFIVEGRDAVVQAKQAELEWETDTDPEAGVNEECDD